MATDNALIVRCVLSFVLPRRTSVEPSPLWESGVMQSAFILVHTRPSVP